MSNDFDDFMNEMDNRACPKCNLRKHRKNDFYKSGGWCRECVNTNRKTEAQKIKRRKWRSESERFQKYKITKNKYLEILIAQDNKCAMCKRDNPGGRFKKWHIDHCHKTNQIRGILCAGCNLFLGRFEKYKFIAEEYLDKHTYKGTTLENTQKMNDVIFYGDYEYNIRRYYLQ